MSSLAFFTFLRISEYTSYSQFDSDWHLTWGGLAFTREDLTVHLRYFATVHLRHSNGDRLRDIVTIPVG